MIWVCTSYEIIKHTDVKYLGLLTYKLPIEICHVGIILITHVDHMFSYK